MASFLFNYSSSSSEHDDFDYDTPVGKKPVYRKLNLNDVDEVIDVDAYDNVGKNKMNIDEDNNIDGESQYDNVKGKEKVYDVENDDDFSFEKHDDVDDDMNFKSGNFEFTNSNKNNVVPFVGMHFNTLDEAERFYRDYGKSVGFEIIIRTTNKHSRGNGISSRLYICHKGFFSYKLTKQNS